MVWVVLNGLKVVGGSFKDVQMMSSRGGLRWTGYFEGVGGLQVTGVVGDVLERVWVALDVAWVRLDVVWIYLQVV